MKKPVARSQPGTVQEAVTIARKRVLFGKRLSQYWRRWSLVHGNWLSIVLLAVIYLYGPLLSSHMALTHEGYYLYARAQQYAEEIRSGFLQPMLMPDVMRGAGFAFPTFYPPFSYALAGLLGILFNQQILAVNVTLFLSALVSSMGCYACGYSISRRSYIAALVSIVSITVTYRFVNTYVRGALAETWGAAWYPIALFGALEVLRTGRRGAWMALGLAGALTSHTVVTMYFVLFLAMLLGITLLFRWHTRTAVMLGIYAILGLGLAAWYIVPQQAYLPDVWASDPVFMWATPEQLATHRVEFEQFFEVEPDRWFGNSFEHARDEMSFKLGLGYLLLFGAVGATLYAWRTTLRQASRMQLGIFAGLTAVVLFGLLFMVYPDPFIRLLPSQFCYLQFPWRLLSVLPFFAATLLALCLRMILNRKQSGEWLVAVLCVVLVAEIPYFYTIRKLKLDITAPMLNAEHARKVGDKGLTEIVEYMPRSYPIEKMGSYHLEQPQTINAIVSAWRPESGLAKCSANVECNTGGGRVTLPLSYYRFWTATTADGQPIQLEPQNGYISMKLPEGISDITLTRRYTRPYHIGWTISGISLILLVLISRRGFRRPGHKPRVLTVR